MIKVLSKTFDVLEYVATCQGRPVLPQELVKALDITQPTCMRIMKDLAQRGYLEQLGPRKGYVLGPVSFFLSGGKRYRQDLFLAADSEIEQCARDIGQSVLLATLHGTWRHILCHHNYNNSLPINNSAPRYSDLYITATGRCLLSFVDEAGFAEAVKGLGLPSENQWPEASQSMNDLLAAVEKIRKTGMVSWGKGMSPSLDVVAFPIFAGGELVGAIGASWPKEDKPQLHEKCVSAVKAASANITYRLSNPLVGG